MTAFQLEAAPIKEAESGEPENDTDSHDPSRHSETSGGSGAAARAEDGKRGSDQGSTGAAEAHSGAALHAAGGRPALVNRPAARYESLL
jgi:hypothetical protein